jgi:hypothetical protein
MTKKHKDRRKIRKAKVAKNMIRTKMRKREKAKTRRIETRQKKKHTCSFYESRDQEY